MKKELFLAISLLFLASCSINQFAVRQAADLLAEAAPTFEEESDVVLAEEAMPANLKVMEGLLQIDPENPDLLLLLSKGYGGYAFSFLENKMELYESTRWKSALYKNRAKRFYRRARDYALRVLSQEEEFKNNLMGDSESFEKVLQIFDEDDVPYLFWAGYNWGNLINLSKEDPAAIADISKAEAMMRRVIELDEAYFFGGAHLFLGVFYGSRPPMLGGNFKKSKEHFERAIHMTNGKFLLAQYMYARFYAVQTQDEELFVKLLHQVQRTPASSMPKQRLANELSKIRARRALQRMDNFF